MALYIPPAYATMQVREGLIALYLPRTYTTLQPYITDAGEGGVNIIHTTYVSTLRPYVTDAGEGGVNNIIHTTYVSTLRHLYPPLCVAVAGGDCFRNKHLAVGTFDVGTYHLIGGSMEGISPPEQARGIYSSAKDDESAMSNEEYLATLSHKQVSVSML